MKLAIGFVLRCTVAKSKSGASNGPILDFGAVPVGCACANLSLRLRNDSDKPVEVFLVSTGGCFAVSDQPDPQGYPGTVTLGPVTLKDKPYECVVSFCPDRDGLCSGLVVVYGGPVTVNDGSWSFSTKEYSCVSLLGYGVR